MNDFEQGLANIMGSFISTELDYIEKSSNELEEVAKERDLYKEVIEEVREYINHEWFKRGQLGIIDKSFQEWQLKDILQILDKAKENK